MKPKVGRPDAAPPADIPPLYVTREDFFTQPAPKKPGRTDADKFSILVVLGVVVLAIIAVIAGGVYLYLHDAPPPPDLKKLSQTNQPNTVIDDPPAEKINMPAPPLLISEPRVESPGILTTLAQAIVPDPPAPKEAPKPKSRPKPREPATVPDKAAEATARSPPEQTESSPPRLAEQAAPQPEAAPDIEPGGNHQANFTLAFGVIVETRIYPSRKMKQRALGLWASDKKILEPDGSINDKYVVKKSEFSPIPGH